MTSVRLRIVESSWYSDKLSLRAEDGIGNPRDPITKGGFKPFDIVYLVKPEEDISVEDTDYFNKAYKVAKDYGLIWEFVTFVLGDYIKGSTLKEAVNFACREWDL